MKEADVHEHVLIIRSDRTRRPSAPRTVTQTILTPRATEYFSLSSIITMKDLWHRELIEDHRKKWIAATWQERQRGRDRLSDVKGRNMHCIEQWIYLSLFLFPLLVSAATAVTDDVDWGECFLLQQLERKRSDRNEKREPNGILCTIEPWKGERRKRKRFLSFFFFHFCLIQLSFLRVRSEKEEEKTNEEKKDLKSKHVSPSALSFSFSSSFVYFNFIDKNNE